MADKKVLAFSPSGYGNWVPTDIAGTLTASSARMAAIIIQPRRTTVETGETDLTDEEMDAFIDAFSEDEDCAI